MVYKGEIGSEFVEVPICEKCNTLFPNDIKWFLSGRIALKYIVQDCEISSISMPKWCCSSMIKPFLDAGIFVSYYEEKPSTDCDAIFLIDYFGFDKHYFVPFGYKGIVIRDVTHSLLSYNYCDADYYFGSLRKWACFITGGFAWGKWKKNNPIKAFDEKYVEYRKEAIMQKKEYLSKKRNDKKYLELFSRANNYLDNCKISGAYEEDVFNAYHMDVELIKSVRRKNASILLSSIKSPFSMKEESCPLFVPILSTKRDMLRKYLIDRNVFCPIHWPQSDLGGYELSLVCDQRYDEDDMNRICELIEQFNKCEGE